MQIELNFKQSLTAGLMAAVSAAVINAVLFFILHTAGIFTDNIYVQPGQALGVVPVLFSSILPTLIASFVFFLFEKYSKNGLRNFGILAIVLLLASFANPLIIPGVTTAYAIGLNFMHIVVVSALFFWINRSKKQNTNIQFTA
jgi:hypothetical protein